MKSEASRGHEDLGGESHGSIFPAFVCLYADELRRIVERTRGQWSCKCNFQNLRAGTSCHSPTLVILLRYWSPGKDWKLRKFESRDVICNAFVTALVKPDWRSRTLAALMQNHDIHPHARLLTKDFLFDPTWSCIHFPLTTLGGFEAGDTV